MQTLSELILELLSEAEEKHETNLGDESRKFVVEVVEQHVRKSVEKYVKGAKEHGDNFLEDVPHLDEMENENIDQMFYTGGAKRSKSLLLKRALKKSKNQ